jgi:hypothetical protein
MEHRCRITCPHARCHEELQTQAVKLTKHQRPCAPLRWGCARACASSNSFSTLSASLALWRCSSLAASCSARASASDDAHVACAPSSLHHVDASYAMHRGRAEPGPCQELVNKSRMGMQQEAWWVRTSGARHTLAHPAPAPPSGTSPSASLEGLNLRITFQSVPACVILPAWGPGLRGGGHS